MRKILLVVAALSVIYVSAIPFRDFWYPDEPDMAEITRAMVTSGERLMLRMNGELFSDYPPLYFWLTSAAALTGGLSEMWLRLPTTLSALALILLTAVWARSRLGERSAFWTAVVLGTGYFFSYQAINMHLDMMFAFFIASAVFCYDWARAAKFSRYRILFFVGSALLMGLAALTKGPAAIILSCGVLLVIHVFYREWRLLGTLALVGLGSTTIFAIWAVLYSRTAGHTSLIHFIYEQSITRFVAGWSHQRGWYYHFTAIWPNLFPWSFFLIFAIPSSWREARSGNRTQALVLTWFVIIFLFFSFSSPGRVSYLLPLYPAVAVMIGSLLSNLLSEEPERRQMIWSISLWPVALILTVGGAFVATCFPKIVSVSPETPGLSFPVFTLGVALLIGGLRLMFCLWRRRSDKALYALPFIIGVCHLFAFSWMLPVLDDPLSAKHDALWLSNQISRDADNVVGFLHGKDAYPGEATALSFYGNLTIERIDSKEDAEAYMARQPHGVIVLEKEDLEEVLYSAGWRIKVLKEFQIGGDRFFAVRMLPKVG